MSRCVLDDEDEDIEIVIGWDPGMGSFFARIFNNQLARSARQDGRTEQEIEEAGLVLWTGGYDRMYETPDTLIEAVTQVTKPLNKEILRRELLQDKARDDGDRTYTIQGDDVEEV